MSKHSKALRDTLGIISSPVVRGRMYEAADHMETLEAQLRIARKALRRLSEDDCNYSAYAESTLLDMRQAGRKK